MPSQNGFGGRNYGIEGFGLFTQEIEIEIENTVGLGTQPFFAVTKVPSEIKIQFARIKNVSSGLVVLNRLSNIPKTLLNQPIILRLAPRQTALIALDAYDPEQIKFLRNSLRILVDPVGV